jgi:UDP-N-acetylmuramate dehydrogenase
MQILKDFNLKEFNTFGVPAKANFFVQLETENDFLELIKTREFIDNERLFLGGGSNVLFTKDYAGIVIVNKIKGIENVQEDNDYVFIKAFGGELWHSLVEYSVNKGYWGLENLALIPGTVGASPMQNIGAYGGELKDTMESLEALDMKTGEKRIFSNNECEFGYRDSIFKNKLKGRYFILSVTFKLSKKQNKKIEYKVLKEYIESKSIDTSSPKNISEAVCDIRKSKLPDPKILGNAGSFFKNIFVDKDKFNELLNIYPEIPSFKDEDNIKIPAGWLIEKAGWKGKRVGNVGVHEKQALVLVNYGGATGEEVKKLSEDIVNSVYSKFGLTLSTEVNFI